MSGSPYGNDPVSRLLNGQAVSPVPVAPVYEGLGPLEDFRHRLWWRKWRDRLDQANTEVLPLDYQTYLAVELEIRTDILEGPYPPPTWMHLSENSSQEDVAGCAIVRRGEELYWLSEQGEASWIAPSLRAKEEQLTAEKVYRWTMRWDEGGDPEALDKVPQIPQHALQPIPEPASGQAETWSRSTRYDAARALQARYRDRLALYVAYGTPFNNVWDVLGFQKTMYALVEQPKAMHRLLEERLPRPSARFTGERLLGAGVIHVEDCMSSADLISPEMYREFAFPYTKQMLEFFEKLGFRTVLYFSGNLMPLLNQLKELPFTALAFEEDRKGYGIDLAEVRRVMGPDRVLFGNIDASFVETASDEQVLAEVRRQIDVAGPDNFIVSPGSPMTPGTSLERVRLFLESTQRL